MRVKELAPGEYPDLRGRYFVEHEDGQPELYNFTSEQMANEWVLAKDANDVEGAERVLVENLAALYGRNNYGHDDAMRDLMTVESLNGAGVPGTDAHRAHMSLVDYISRMETDVDLLRWRDAEFGDLIKVLEWRLRQARYPELTRDIVLGRMSYCEHRKARATAVGGESVRGGFLDELATTEPDS